MTKWLVTFQNGEVGTVDAESRSWAIARAEAKYANGPPDKVEPMPEPKISEVEK